MLGRLNHIALVVPDLAAATQRWRDLFGATVSTPQDLPNHGVRVVFITLPNTKIELLEPLGANSPVADFLIRQPRGGLHHLCIEVADAEAARQHICAQLGPEALAPDYRQGTRLGAHDTPVIFLHPRAMGFLLELEQV